MSMFYLVLSAAGCLSCSLNTSMFSTHDSALNAARRCVIVCSQKSFYLKLFSHTIKKRR